MKKITIYDPPMCCSTGLCGPNPDQVLIELNDTITEIKKLGGEIERYLITQSPEKFKENPKVIELIQKEQLKALPVTEVDGEIVKKGSYPTKAELYKFAGIEI